MRLSFDATWFAAILWVVASQAQAAVTSDPDPPPPSVVDTAPCFAAISSGNDDGVIEKCSALIGNAGTEPADRVTALAARAATWARRDKADAAIADYEAALKLDPLRPDLLNARGTLWRGKDDRPRAIRDFGAALKLDPQNEAVRANYRALAQEIERLGAKMSVQPQPSKSPLK